MSHCVIKSQNDASYDDFHQETSKWKYNMLCVHILPIQSELEMLFYWLRQICWSHHFLTMFGMYGHVWYVWSWYFWPNDSDSRCMQKIYGSMPNNYCQRGLWKSFLQEQWILLFSKSKKVFGRFFLSFAQLNCYFAFQGCIKKSVPCHNICHYEHYNDSTAKSNTFVPCGSKCVDSISGHNILLIEFVLSAPLLRGGTRTKPYACTITTWFFLVWFGWDPNKTVLILIRQGCSLASPYGAYAYAATRTRTRTSAEVRVS